MMQYDTPDVPDEIKKIDHPQYRNIYSYNLGNKNFWGTESLLGDWSGKYLLVAKDFYPSKYIEDSTDPEPYRHNPKAPTNRNLIKTLRHFGQYRDGTSNTDCGFLYVSACFLLRADGEVRGALPDEGRAMALSWPALKFTFDNMPNLRHVILMGREAQRAMKGSSLLSSLERRGGEVHEVRHPANAMSDATRFAEWEAIFS